MNVEEFQGHPLASIPPTTQQEGNGSMDLQRRGP